MLGSSSSLCLLLFAFALSKAETSADEKQKKAGLSGREFMSPEFHGQAQQNLQGLWSMLGPQHFWGYHSFEQNARRPEGLPPMEGGAEEPRHKEQGAESNRRLFHDDHSQSRDTEDFWLGEEQDQKTGAEAENKLFQGPGDSYRGDGPQGPGGPPRGPPMQGIEETIDEVGPDEEYVDVHLKIVPLKPSPEEIEAAKKQMGMAKQAANKALQQGQVKKAEEGEVNFHLKMVDDNSAPGSSVCSSAVVGLVLLSVFLWRMGTLQRA